MFPNTTPDPKYNKSTSYTTNGLSIEKIFLKERNFSVFGFCVRSAKKCLSFVFWRFMDSKKTILSSFDLHNQIIVI